MVNPIVYTLHRQDMMYEYLDIRYSISDPNNITVDTVLTSCGWQYINHTVHTGVLESKDINTGDIQILHPIVSVEYHYRKPLYTVKRKGRYNMISWDSNNKYLSFVYGGEWERSSFKFFQYRRTPLGWDINIWRYAIMYDDFRRVTKLY